jgi:peptidoglycan/LPS O-acetylase OafA/YrhL
LNVTASPLRLAGGWLPGHLGYGVLAACLTYAVATYPLGILVNRYTRFLGRISYSAYLLHFLVLDTLAPLVAPITEGHPVVHLFLLGGTALALTTAVASIAFALVEIPGIELGRRLIPSLTIRSRRAAEAF